MEEHNLFSVPFERVKVRRERPEVSPLNPIVHNFYFFWRYPVLLYDNLFGQLRDGNHAVGFLHAASLNLIDARIDVRTATPIKLRRVHVHYQRLPAHPLGL